MFQTPASWWFAYNIPFPRAIATSVPPTRYRPSVPSFTDCRTGLRPLWTVPSDSSVPPPSWPLPAGTHTAAGSRWSGLQFSFRACRWFVKSYPTRRPRSSSSSSGLLPDGSTRAECSRAPWICSGVGADGFRTRRAWPSWKPAPPSKWHFPRIIFYSHVQGHLPARRSPKFPAFFAFRGTTGWCRRSRWGWNVPSSSQRCFIANLARTSQPWISFIAWHRIGLQTSYATLCAC